MQSFFKILLITLFLPSVMQAQSVPPSADAVMKDAYRQAAREGKNVFVIFHASWCVWCHRMDTSMNDASCKKFFDDHYVIRHLAVDESKDKKNLENPGANEFRNKYGGADLGIPYWLIFDSNGKLLADSRIRIDGNLNSTPGDNSGCPATEKEVAYFIKILKQTSNLSADEEIVIAKRFRQNEH
ncbi:MAG: thioredoxin family protein [Bacteroidetes bacterium]|nr:thioredoxin family protein [Bacteroidota bacterium]MBS1931173.1 thioredoxin family protein [Bacteroidota bacterium]